MIRPIDITGQRFGKLVALHLAPERRASSGSGAFWVFRCDCGNVIEKGASRVRWGGQPARSCGCLSAPLHRRKGVGMHLVRPGSKLDSSRSPELRVWDQMRQRCYNPYAMDYSQYGLRGVKVCPRWNLSPLNFIQDMGPRPPGARLVLVDPAGDFEPGNCRWQQPEKKEPN